MLMKKIKHLEYLKNMSIQLSQSCHSILWYHVGYKRKSFRFLGEAVDGEVNLS